MRLTDMDANRMAEMRCGCGNIVILPWYYLEGALSVFCAPCAKRVQTNQYGQITIEPLKRKRHVR